MYRGWNTLLAQMIEAARDLPTGPGPTPAALATCEALGDTGSPGAVGREATCVMAAG